MTNNLDNTKKLETMFEFYFKFRELGLNKLFEMYKDSYDRGFIISGVGKNWWIAEEITRIFISRGIKCQALDCTHALHGDLGMVDNQHIIFLSKSGTTSELITLAKHIRSMRDLKLINPTLCMVCLNTLDETMVGPVFDDYVGLPDGYTYEDMYEFGEDNKTPSISLAIQELLLSELGTLLIKNDKEKLDRYKFNHPAGKIGESFKCQKI